MLRDRTILSLTGLALCALLAGCSSPPPKEEPSPGARERSYESGPLPTGQNTNTRETREVLKEEPAPWPDEEPVSAPAPANNVVVSLNRGEGAGIAVGDVYDVFAEGEALVDPDTGEVLGSNEVKVARVEVAQVLPKFSKARLVAGEPEKGDVCRVAQGQAAFGRRPASAGAAAGQAGKATLAVAPFTFHRNVRAIPGTELETATLTQKFVTELVKTRKFDVLERARLETLMQEYDLGASGLADPARAAKAGKVAGADFFLMGEISVWTLTTEVKQVPIANKWMRQSELRLIVDMRIVDTRTSKVVSAEKGDAVIAWKEMSNSRPAARFDLEPVRLDEIQRDLIAELTRKVIDAVYPIRVIAVSRQAPRPAPPPPPPSDRTPPTITILSPRADALVTAAPVNVVVEVRDDRGVERVVINNADAAQDAQGRYRVRLSRPNDGANGVRVEAWDAAGNRAMEQITFRFDATPPAIEGDATLSVEGKVDDLECTLTINGVNVDYDKQTGRYSVKVPADPQDPGRVVIVATDPYGNESREERRIR